MPSISKFFGITIYMYKKDPNPSHFHALFNGDDCIVDINKAKAKGKKRIFDCKKFLFDEDYAKELKNIDLFMKAKADHHTVMWTDELDISPEYLYENSVKEKNFA